MAQPTKERSSYSMVLTKTSPEGVPKNFTLGTRACESVTLIVLLLLVIFVCMYI